MCDILCVTNRALCVESLTERIEKLAKSPLAGIILREKDLSEAEYEKLAASALGICRNHGMRCILHSYTGAAIRLDADAVHLPLHILRTVSDADKAHFLTLGASCHSVEDAIEAQSLGCTYITAGHVFDTDCKKGLPGRGLEFLRRVCESVTIPVYAIGGISAGNIADVLRAGASGACVMSGLMTCSDVWGYLERFEVSE